MWPVFGRQENAAVGYNPRYRGKRSYNPLLRIEANCSYLWDTELRPGNAGTWDGSVELLETCFFNVPPDIRELRVRADAGLGFNPADPSLQRARNSRHSRASSTRDDHPMCLYKRVPAACSKLFGSKLKNLRAM